MKAILISWTTLRDVKKSTFKSIERRILSQHHGIQASHHCESADCSPKTPDPPGNWKESPALRILAKSDTVDTGLNGHKVSQGITRSHNVTLQLHATSVFAIKEQILSEMSFRLWALEIVAQETSNDAVRILQQAPSAYVPLSAIATICPHLGEGWWGSHRVRFYVRLLPSSRRACARWLRARPEPCHPDVSPCVRTNLSTNVTCQSLSMSESMNVRTYKNTC